MFLSGQSSSDKQHDLKPAFTTKAIIFASPRSIIHWGLVLTVLTTATLSANGEDKPATARELMKQAHESRGVWHNFPGFTSEIVATTDGVQTKGKIVVKPDFSLTLSLETAPHEEWLKAKLDSVIRHRRPSEMKEAEYLFVENDGPGDLVTTRDRSGVFRIENGLIKEVLRKSPERWFEISNVKLQKTPSGLVFPNVTAVTYRDPSSGDIQKQRTNLFEWESVGSFLLPSRTLTVETAEGGKRTVRELRFKNHQLTPLKNNNLQTSFLHQPLPEALTSFSAAVQGEYLYVFSGHNGDAHGSGLDALANHFRRIKYDDPNAKWEDLTKQPPAQSTALVSDGKFLYRIAGLTFLNRGNESTNFKSTTHFTRYDVEKNEWTELTPLPEPRSSLDAALVGRSIFVAGGWILQGESSRDAKWHKTILRYDLDNPESGWQTIEGPGYIVRALSVAAHQGKFYMIGGIQKRGFSRKVSIYDPEKGTWSEGPELKQDSSTAGFATSSFASGGRLYVTGGSGVVYRLSEDGSEWEIADRLLFPRMFLRLLPLPGERLIALGGTGSGLGSMPIVESLYVGHSENPNPKMVRWSIPFEGRALHSQVLILDGNKLYTVGGNASSAPHDFSEEAFVKESFVFDLGRQKVEKLPDLPVALQSGTGLQFSMTSEHDSILVAGGLGFQEGKFTSLNQVLRYHPESKTWETAGQLPASRAMFNAAVHDDAIWMFGGAISGKERKYHDTVLHWWGDDSNVAPIANTIIPTPRRSFGGAVLEENYYMVGGLSKGSGISETVDVFNFSKRKWHQAASPNVPRVFPSLVSSGDKLYLFGGFTNKEGHFSPAESLEAFDAKTNSWSTVVDRIDGVAPSMSMLNMNGRLLFYGINPEHPGVANFVLYDPAPRSVPKTVKAFSFSRSSNSKGEAKKNAKNMMRKDSNKDNKLTRKELGNRLTAFFDQADTDKSEDLTFEELVAALKAQEEESSESSN